MVKWISCDASDVELRVRILLGAKLKQQKTEISKFLFFA